MPEKDAAPKRPPGRPRTYKARVILKLDLELNKRLSAVALAEGITRSGIVERAVLDSIERLR